MLIMVSYQNCPSKSSWSDTVLPLPFEGVAVHRLFRVRLLFPCPNVTAITSKEEGNRRMCKRIGDATLRHALLPSSNEL